MVVCAVVLVGMVVELEYADVGSVVPKAPVPPLPWTHPAEQGCIVVVGFTTVNVIELVTVLWAVALSVTIVFAVYVPAAHPCVENSNEFDVAVDTTRLLAISVPLFA